MNLQSDIEGTQPQGDQNDHLTSSKPPDLTSLMLARHSTRSFLPCPVPMPLLHSALSLAQRTPSNSNLQPWRLKIVTGHALYRLSAALLAAVASGAAPSTAPIPDTYRHYRSALGRELYGPRGYAVSRDDKEGMEKARRRNYEFFGAPLGIIVCMDGRLDEVDVMCVGMYVQTLCLLLAERGLGSCVQVSVAGYPGVVREMLGIGEEIKVLSGIAVGYEDAGVGLNALEVGRDAWGDCVEFFK